MTMTQTQTCEPSTVQIPARRRRLEPLPVLIEIPNLAVGSVRGSRPRVHRRRRLRREVRVVGYALLVILPLSMAFLTVGGDRRLPRGGSLVVDPSAVQGIESTVDRRPVISLAPLEPVITIQADREIPVVLPGYLLPADVSEESRDGGH